MLRPRTQSGPHRAGAQHDEHRSGEIDVDLGGVEGAGGPQAFGDDRTDPLFEYEEAGV
ncbi:hypothetical protein [Planctomonas psychrotolerans]|uniref:hypothetical protein n=1 Tax=Planctomonas psychrotolerans TaxID=2528712 RepID=UPI001D0CFE4F|nr:hypothetical protein [Planctomonas psychrotolerans]